MKLSDDILTEAQQVTAPTSYAALLPILASRRTSVHLTSRTAAQLVAAKR